MLAFVGYRRWLAQKVLTMRRSMTGGKATAQRCGAFSVRRIAQACPRGNHSPWCECASVAGSLLFLSDEKKQAARMRKRAALSAGCPVGRSKSLGASERGPWVQPRVFANPKKQRIDVQEGALRGKPARRLWRVRRIERPLERSLSGLHTRWPHRHRTLRAGRDHSIQRNLLAAAA